MKVQKGLMVALGYGKFFRSDSIVGVEPIEKARGPGQRAKVYVQNLDHPIIASRSENAILRDLIRTPREITKSREQYQLLVDIFDTIREINPTVRSIIQDQGNWNLDRVEERIRETLEEDSPTLPGM